MRARVYSKNLTGLLEKHSPSFRMRSYDKHPIDPKNNQHKKPPTVIPKECFRDNTSIIEFLRYYITCDGGPEFSVYKRKDRNLIQLHMAVKIGCNNEKVKSQLLEMFKIIGIQTNNRNDGLAIESLENIIKFDKLIGFLEESKVRRGKLFNGYQKNDVIKMMIFCKQLTKKSFWINKNFNSLIDIERFLIRCIQLIYKKEKLKQLVKNRLNIMI
jgi:hypothetical protein